MTHLLRGGHIDTPERIRRGLRPHPSLALDKPDIEGQVTIENRGRHNDVCHFVDHYRRVSKRFLSPRGAAKFYIGWEFHLPGDLDGWKVV